MSGWRYIAQRLTGDGAGQFLDFDVPLQGVSLTRVLSGPDALSATIPVEVARLMGDDGRPLFEEWGTAIYAEADGQIRSGGILVRSAFDGPKWSLECAGFRGYLTDLPYTSSQHFVEADPLDIVRHIWQHVQAQPGGNLGVVVDGTTSPVRIGEELEQVEFDTTNGPVSFEAGPKKLAYWLTDDLGKEVDDLAKTTPFDYDDEHIWLPDGTIQHRFRLYYPSKGRRREDLRFVSGENITAQPSIERDGDEYCNEVLMLGAGEGRDMVRASHSRPDGRLRRVAVHSDKAVRSTAAAARVAAAELAARSGLDDVRTVEVRNHPHAPIGSFDVGDEILVEGETGWQDFSLWCRVLSYTINPDESDTMSLTIARTDTVTAA